MTCHRKETALFGSAAWGFRAMTPEQQIEAAAKLGLRTHELGIANADTDLPLDVSGERLAAVCKQYKEAGLELFCAATGDDLTTPDAAEATRQTEKLNRVLRICHDAGIHALRVFAGFRKIEDMTDAVWENLLRSIRIAAEEAKRQNVVLAIETHGAVDPFGTGVKHFRSATTQIDTLQRILDAAGKSVQLVFDPANLFAVGEEDLEAFWNAFCDRICYVHLKDFLRDADGTLHPTAAGMGSTRWGGLLQTIRDSGKPVLFEYENCEDVLSGTAACLDFWNEQTK